MPLLAPEDVTQESGAQWSLWNGARLKRDRLPQAWERRCGSNPEVAAEGYLDNSSFSYSSTRSEKIFTLFWNGSVFVMSTPAFFKMLTG
jgi:hypothetical protein